MWFLILGRSSASNKLGLIVIPAVIDTGFRGDLFANVYNTHEHEVKIQEGQRVAQMVPFELHAAGLSMMAVAELDDSERGVGGFGSSGH
jgi:dUTP pyrophosphatase